jgi:hypothetical protein
MSTDTEIRTAMRHVADGLEPPPIDHLGFGRQVRRHRRRRRAGGAAVVAVAAAAALVVPLAVQNAGSDPGAASAPSAPNPPAYFAAGTQLMMLDRAGTVREVDFQTEGIVGPTARGVLLHGMDGGLAHLRVEPDGDVERLDLAVREVYLALVSADGARFATVAWDDPDLVTYDLASGKEVDRISGIDDLSVFYFSDRLLYRDGRSLWLGSGDDAVRLPIPDGSASVGGDVVSIHGFDETTRLYDVSSGSPVEVAQVPGRMGEVSPGGRYYAAGVEDDGSPVQLWERATGDLRAFTGVTGEAEQVRWLDADTALAVVPATRDDESVNLLFECEVAALRCVEVYVAESDLALGS